MNDDRWTGDLLQFGERDNPLWDWDPLLGKLLTENVGLRGGRDYYTQWPPNWWDVGQYSRNGFGARQLADSEIGSSFREVELEWGYRAERFVCVRDSEHFDCINCDTLRMIRLYESSVS